MHLVSKTFINLSCIYILRGSDKSSLRFGNHLRGCWGGGGGGGLPIIVSRTSYLSNNFHIRVGVANVACCCGILYVMWLVAMVSCM